MKRVAALRIRWMEERGKCEKQCALMEQRDSGERERVSFFIADGEKKLRSEQHFFFFCEQTLSFQLRVLNLTSKFLFSFGASDDI